MPALLEVKYFNTFWLKKIVDDGKQWGARGAAAPAGATPADETSFQAIWPGSDPAGANVCGTNNTPGIGGQFGLGFYPTPKAGDYAVTDAQIEYGEKQEDRCWFIEESRIRGGFNNTMVDLGVKAYIVEEKPLSFRRASSMIYSGVFNSKTNVNETNQFPTGEDISKTADPHYGSLQKMYAEDSNLIIFQEDKISRALIDKDAIYSAEGQGTVTTSPVVIGQITPYVGEYGISKNPESFAKYGFRKYCVDKDRGVVLRLSRDGLTEISSYGMSDYFRDLLAEIPDSPVKYSLEKSPLTIGNNLVNFSINSDIFPELGSLVEVVLPNGAVISISGCYVIGVREIATNNINVELNIGIDIPSLDCVIRFQNSAIPKIPGGWDIHNRNYTISLNNSSNYFPLPEQNLNEQTVLPPSIGYKTLAFDDSINGWVSFYTYNPTFMGSLKDTFYSFYKGNIYNHYATKTNTGKSNNYQIFYGVKSLSSITFIFNPNPSLSKNFLTINYEGSNGWEVDAITSGYQGYQTIPSQGNSWAQEYPNNLSNPQVWKQFQDNANSIRSNAMSGYYDTEGDFQYAGFTRKENKYVANLVNNSQTRPQEVLFGPNGFNNVTSGIKGYFSVIKVSTDLETDPHGPKELFSVGSVWQLSSQ